MATLGAINLGIGSLFGRLLTTYPFLRPYLERGGGIDFAEYTPPVVTQPPPPLPPPPEVIAPPPPPPPIIAPLPPLVPVLPTPPIAPPPVTGGQILEELLTRPHVPGTSRPPTVNPDFERLLRRAPETDLERLLRGTFRPKGGTVARAAVRAAASTARILGSGAIGVLGGILTPSPLGSDDIITAEEAESRRRRPKGPRTRPPRRPVGTRRPGPLPYPPPISPPGPLETVVVEAPRVTARPAGRPTPRPTPPPTSRPTVDPRALLPYLLPLALPLLSPGGRPSPLSFQLPGGQPLPSPPLPSPLAPGLPGMPAAPLPALLPTPAPLTGFQPGTLPLLQPPPSDPCQCTTTRRKRKPKKPREICYAGEYRERRTGLTKERLRKIPCQ